jgi:acetylglutamate kinase
LRAEKLILMTDVPGVMRDKNDPSTKFTSLTIRQCKELEEEGIIAGGMIPKVNICGASFGTTKAGTFATSAVTLVYVTLLLHTSCRYHHV